MSSSTKSFSRVPAIDLARGIALIAMAIFHFAWDLENFSIAHKGMTIEPFWKYFARSIAASFLILVGISAWLAHHNGINRRVFVKRLAMVSAAALAITIATFFATPNGFIFFGILHNIAFSSVAILLFLQFPHHLLFPTSLAILTAHLWARSPLLDSAYWWWSGLSQISPKANDYVPVFPWFGWVVFGLAIAKFMHAHQFWPLISGFPFKNPVAKFLRFLGRNSLVFYLLHQPVMIGILYTFVHLSAGI